MTTSNATHDSNGILHALNAHTGKEVWVFEATEGPLNNPVSWGLRITPAVTGMYAACTCSRTSCAAWEVVHTTQCTVCVVCVCCLGNPGAS